MQATRVVYGICSIYATCSALGLSPVKHLLKNASFFGAAELTIRVEALSLSDDFQVRTISSSSSSSLFALN